MASDQTRICVINSTNVVTLIGGRGVIANGTQNVIVYCICSENNEAAVGPTVWYFNGNQITLTEDDGSGNPYYRVFVVPGSLIFPTFTATHVGTYICANDGLEQMNGTVFLTLGGMCSFIVYFNMLYCHTVLCWY